MDTTQDPRTLHHRRRWYYVLWVLLLVAAVGFLAWWETPAREGTARLQIELAAPDLPADTRIALWTGTVRTWDPAWQPRDGWRSVQAGALRAGPAPIRIARRRWGQGLLMRRTDDLAIAVLEAPGGERRWFVYDLREDLGGPLTIGRTLTVKLSTTWAGLPRSAALPAAGQRKVVGH